MSGDANRVAEIMQEWQYRVAVIGQAPAANELAVALEREESSAIALRAERDALRAALRRAIKVIPRPWIDGGVTFAEWEAAWVAIDAALEADAEKTT